MTTRRAVLDADIIFSRVLHELLGRLAVGPRLFDLVWSDELLDEAKSSLVKKKGLSDQAAEAWVGHMRREFASGQVNPASVADDTAVESLTRDPTDVHVCALAIAGNVELLFTFDRGYLKGPLRKHGVEVPDLDEFLVDQCLEQPEVFARVIERQADAWGGGRPVAELLAALGRANVPRLAEALAPLVEPTGQ